MKPRYWLLVALFSGFTIPLIQWARKKHRQVEPAVMSYDWLVTASYDKQGDRE